MNFYNMELFLSNFLHKKIVLNNNRIKKDEFYSIEKTSLTIEPSMISWFLFLVLCWL